MKRTSLICASALLVSLASASAAVVFRSGNGTWIDGQWTNGGNSPGLVSGQDDNPSGLNNGRVLTLDTDRSGDLGTIGTFNVGNQNPGSPTSFFTTTGNAVLSVANLFIGANGSAGDMTLQDGANITVGTTFLMGRDTLHNGTDVPASSTLTFELGATGWTTPLTIGGSTLIRNGLVSQFLVIDGAAFSETVGGSHLLIDGNNGSFAAGDISFINFGPQYTPSISQVAGDISLNVLVIPEPSSFALLGLGLAALTLHRRRS